MKPFSVIFLVFLSCSSMSSNITKHMSIMDRDLLISCRIEKGNLLLSIKNNTNNPIVVNNPCSINTFVKVKDGDKEMNPLIKIKPDPTCADKVFEILPQEEKVFINPCGNYSLTDLYDLKTKIRYEISVVYYPTASQLRKNEGIESVSCFSIAF